MKGLQQAHADHIQAIYRGLESRPGNPDGAEIRSFGDTRAFAANKNRLENRAILTGNEQSEELDEIFRYIAARSVRCVIEINPANFYRTEQFSWKTEVRPLLQERCCTIEDFRCVWCCDRQPERMASPRIERFGPERMEAFLGELKSVYQEDDRREASDQIRYGEGGKGWLHYIGYGDNRLASTGTLFCHADSGYLAWWFAHPDHRRHGHQTAGIRQRAADAFDLGCVRAFTVTDFSIQSSINLQWAGFRLAYNYLLVYREPLPVD